MASCNYTSVISVCEERRDGGFWVLTSENLAGLLLCGKDLKKLRLDVPAAIKMLFKMNYEMDVEVCPIAEPVEMASKLARKRILHPARWAAVPIHA